MAQAPHLATVGIGEVDLLADLRVSRSAGSVIDSLRLQVVVEAAAVGLLAPVAPTSTDFRDLDSFRTTTRALVDLGFRSRTAIHPAQVPVINEVLTPGEAEVAAARDVLARFEQAGEGVTTDVHGHLIDLAVVRGARETLTRAGA
jgi:citrate lyase subunit beta / citryl-CoA lyase